MHFGGGLSSSLRTVGGKVEGVRVSAGEVTLSISV